MGSQIDDLVRMRDAETLYELMAEDEDWMIQLDAAEGLVKLGDKRGLEFLVSATLNDEQEVRDVAKEILNNPVVKQMQEDIEAGQKRELQKLVDKAKKRLQQGKKVFRYKMIFLPPGDFLNEDPFSEGFDVPALSGFGFEGWEIVNMLPHPGQAPVRKSDEYLSGAYFLLKREVSADESAELDEV